MTAEPAEPSPPPAARLNPFVFPSDTTFRFLLVLVAVIGANLYVWNWLWIAYGANQDAVRAAYAVCETIRPTLDIRGLDPATYAQASQAFSDCVRDVNRPMAWWLAGGTALLIAVAVAIGFLIPYWITRRRNLRPLTDEEAPIVVAELDELANEAGLDERPRWRWNPLDPSPSGLAFGRPGSHTVALMGGLVTRQIADPPAFRAVVRHELAHLRNRDVGLTYATISLWYAFLLVGVLPFAVVVADEGIDTVLALGWRLLALTALVYLTRNAVLRAREVYADVRASVPDESHGALRRILGGMPRRSTTLWRRLWSVHPDPHARLAAVDDTRGLFSLGVLVAFGAGVAATIAYDSLVTFVGFYVTDPLDIRLIAAIPAAPLVIGVVGIGVWRGAWAALAENRARPPTWALALGLAAGFLVGPQLALERAVRVEGDSTLLETAFGTGVLWIVLLIASLVLVLAWVGASAESWIRAVAGSERPARATLAGLVFASGFLAVFLAVFTYARESRTEIPKYAAIEHSIAAEIAWVGPKWLWNVVENAWLLSVLRVPVIMLALAVLWLFPLAAWLRRRKQASDPAWAFLDPGGRLHTRVLERAWLEPWLIGLGAGAVCVGAFVVLRVGMRASFDEDVRLQEIGFAYAYSYWQYLIALGAQAAAGIMAAVRARELRLVYALAAAFATGVVAVAGIEILVSVGSCVDAITLGDGSSSCGWYGEVDEAWRNFRYIVPMGALAALAGGLVVLGVRTVLGRRHAPVTADVVDAPG